MTAAVALAAASCSYVLAGDPLLGTAQSVAQGGCVARCSPGWRCEPKSATCEREPADAGAPEIDLVGTR